MSRKRISLETYQKLIAAYRRPTFENNVRSAALEAGVRWETAKRMLEEGWPDKGLPSMRAIRTEEQIQARARLQTEMAARTAHKEKEAEEAHKQAVESRKQEGTMVGLVRGATLQNLAAVTGLAQAARTLAPVVKAFIDLQAEKLKMWTAYETQFMQGNAAATPPALAKPALTAHQALDLLHRVAALTATITNTAQQAMEMERLHLGKPTEIIGVMSAHVEMTYEEAVARAEAANNAIAHFRESGEVRLVETKGQELPELGELVEEV
jgi:hypothetical protein